MLTFTDMSILNLKLDARKLSVDITKLLNAESINKLAKEAGFDCRKGGKLKGFQFLDILLFTHFNFKQLSLNDLSSQLAIRYGIKIRKQSIDERFSNRAIDFFKIVLEKAINCSINRNIKIDFTSFEKVRIKDSTSFQLPENMKDEYPGSGGSASEACIRIQFEYDLKNGKILDLSLHPYTTQDMTNAKETIDDIKPNELVIRDMGYVKIEYLQIIENQHAFYLNRLQSSTNVYEIINEKYVEIDFWKLHKHMKANGLIRIDKEVYIGSKDKFKTRMIIELLPDEIYQERLRKAKKNAKKKKRNIGNKYKAKLGLNIFITNTEIPANQVRLLYTLRWQIELMFKIWKSIGEIDKVKKMKVKRFEACLLAKLIWIAINWQIMRRIVICFFNEEDIKISPYKLFKTLKASIMEFRVALKSGIKYMLCFINKIVEISPENHISEKKKNTLTWSYDVIRMF